jgi:hypothetical protein
MSTTHWKNGYCDGLLPSKAGKNQKEKAELLTHCQNSHGKAVKTLFTELSSA